MIFDWDWDCLEFVLILSIGLWTSYMKKHQGLNMLVVKGHQSKNVQKLTIVY